MVNHGSKLEIRPATQYFGQRTSHIANPTRGAKSKKLDLNLSSLLSPPMAIDSAVLLSVIPQIVRSRL